MVALITDPVSRKENGVLISLTRELPLRMASKMKWQYYELNGGVAPFLTGKL